MAQASEGAQGRAVRGIEAAAFVLEHAVGAYALAGGEGARRLAAALEQARAARSGGPARLEGDGLEGARAALGAAAAGRRVALLASGEALLAALPALHEAARLGLPLLVVVPSHGADAGATLPEPVLADVAHLAQVPAGVLLASDAEQVADFVLAGLRAAADRGAPWVVAFELGAVGLALANATLPSAEFIRLWASAAPSAGRESAPAVAPPAPDLERHLRDLERFGFAVGAAMRDLERQTHRRAAPSLADGVHDAEVVLVAAGAAARAARFAVPHLHARGGRHVGAVQVASLRPFPAAEVVRLCWRARAVIVHEALPDALAPAGALSGAVRAAFADALTWHPGFTGIGRIPPVVTVLGPTVTPNQWIALTQRVIDAADPPRVLLATGADGNAAATQGPTPEIQIEITMGEGERERALRLLVDWLARTGTTVSAHGHEPTRAGISVARRVEQRGPAHVLLALPDGHYDPARLAALPPGALVVLAGDFPDRVLADTMRAAAARGVRVATLGGNGAAPAGVIAAAAVLRSLVAPGPEVDAALASAFRAQDDGDADAAVARVRALAETLGAHFS